MQIFQHREEKFQLIFRWVGPGTHITQCCRQQQQPTDAQQLTTQSCLGSGECVNMSILTCESLRPSVLYLSILSARSVLKSHRGSELNQVQTCRCWGSQGTVASHWYEAVHHRCICRATTSDDAILLYVFFFVTFFFTYVFCKTNITFKK